MGIYYIDIILFLLIHIHKVKIFDNIDLYYQRFLPYVCESRERVLYQYNIFPFIKSYIDSCVDLEMNKVNKIQIYPYDSYKKNRFNEFVLRVKRTLYKII